MAHQNLRYILSWSSLWTSNLLSAIRILPIQYSHISDIVVVNYMSSISCLIVLLCFFIFFHPFISIWVDRKPNIHTINRGITALKRNLHAHKHTLRTDNAMGRSHFWLFFCCMWIFKIKWRDLMRKNTIWQNGKHRPLLSYDTNIPWDLYFNLRTLTNSSQSWTNIQYPI